MIKAEKQKNALIYAIEQYPQIGRTKLMKFVFLVDLFAFNTCGEPLLEDEYKRLQNGPVPSYGFANTDSTNNLFRITKEPCDPERIIYQYVPKEKADMSSFKTDEIRLFDKILLCLKNHKTEEISELTHRFNLWKKASNNAIIPIEDLKLDDYEYDELESFIYYTNAVAEAKQLNNYPDTDSGDSVPEDLVIIQFQTMCGDN